MIIREREPLNLEYPFDELTDFITSSKLFYVRSHFPAPDISESSYKLRVAGAVQHSLSFTLDELRAMPSETITATLECAGNSRVFLVPQENGAQWELGAVGTAEWTGVRLSTVLQRAGLEPDACEVVLEGADCGVPKEKPKPPQPISFARSIPVEKALSPEVLIAYQMNGEPLTRDHGFPVRAIVPGFYGMASVKWLVRVEVLRSPFAGYWQTSEYAYWNEIAGMAVRRPVSEMMLKSEIARPRMYEVVPCGEHYAMVGAAWSGAKAVVQVEISVDGGETWSDAEITDPIRPFAWRRWKFNWQTPEAPGRPILLARARDEAGNVQPAEHDRKHGSYIVHHTLPIHVFVE